MPIWACWWCSGRQNAARDENTSPNGTRPCLWLEGGVGLEENHRNTKNAPCGACFSCSVRVSRVGGGGGSVGGGGGRVNKWFKKKKENFLFGWERTPTPHSFVLASVSL